MRGQIGRVLGAMSKPFESDDRDRPGDWDWDFEGTRRHHLELGRSLTPEQRLRWLEETVDEMLELQGLARKGRPLVGP
jgi:hypothetical protein